MRGKRDGDRAYSRGVSVVKTCRATPRGGRTGGGRQVDRLPGTAAGSYFARDPDRRPGTGLTANRSRRPAIRALPRFDLITHTTSLSVERSHFSRYGFAFDGAAAAATLH